MFYNVITVVQSENKKPNKNTLSDLEILALDSHPKIYGDYNDAEIFGKGYKKVAVINTNQKSHYEDKLLLVATSDKKIISDITINFSYSDEIKHELTVDKILKVVCEYIPYEILEKYYTFSKSFHETYKEGKNMKPIIMLCPLIRKAKLLM